MAPTYTSGVRKQCSCAQWYIGSAWISTSPAVISPSTITLTYWAIRHLLVSMTPLGRDSVPLV